MALAWGYLFLLNHQMSPALGSHTLMTEMGMPMAQPWNIAELFFTFMMWAIMMVGMMTGSAAPMMLLFAGAHARRGHHRIPLIVLIFGLGHITVWIGFSACAALAQSALHHAGMLSPAMAALSPYVGGVILCAAGLYQLTPLKQTCLMHCQSPLGFLVTHWRDGALGALQMGMRHGAYCLGCCWALMCVLFVVGVMNLFWVAALTLFVLLEKTGPAGMIVARAAGTLMILTAVMLFASA
jgi:predicted metal-binding membrane protein